MGSIGLFGQSSATFSGDGMYRFRLDRKWSDGVNYCNFLMLNPSTADAVANDPTVERCQRRAQLWGYDGLIVTNLFALRSTNPDKLKAVVDPVGNPDNDDAILEAATKSGIVICAWGNNGPLLN